MLAQSCALERELCQLLQEANVAPSTCPQAPRIVRSKDSGKEVFHSVAVYDDLMGLPPPCPLRGCSATSRVVNAPRTAPQTVLPPEIKPGSHDEATDWVWARIVVVRTRGGQAAVAPEKLVVAVAHEQTAVSTEPQCKLGWSDGHGNGVARETSLERN